MEEQKTGKKPLQLVTKIISIILIVFTTFIMLFTIISVTTFDRNDRSLLGFKFYIVQSDSMSLSENNAHLDVHFNAGDIVIVKNVKDPTALQPGDIISFVTTDDNNKYITVTHMIREPRYTTEGKLIGYQTFGTNTGVNDETIVEPEFILGQYVGHLPKVGYFFTYVKSTPGYIICILIPFLMLIIVNALDVFKLFKKYKKEQNAIIDAEKAEIAADRQRNEDMLRELMALKQELEAQKKEMASTKEDVKEEATQEQAEATEEKASEVASEESTDSNEDGNQ